MLLFALTSVSDFVCLCTALWLAGYLISRGFGSATTFRTVLIVLLLGGAFIEGYISLNEPLKSHYAWYVSANLLAVLVWFNLTFQWLPRPAQRRMRAVAGAIYAMGLLAIVVMVLPATGLSGPGPGVRVANADTPPALSSMTFMLQQVFIFSNAVFLLAAATTTIFNFRQGSQAGLSPGSRAMWFATLLGAAAMGYGMLSFVVGASLPRLGLDALVFAALIMLGLAVARHQAFVERRTTLQDLPVAATAILVIVGFYALATQRAGFSAGQIALVASLAVFTHSMYDLARELLDRLLQRQESELRHQLHQLARDVGGADTLTANLQAALGSLVRTLQASGGFVAVKQGEQFAVLASVRSLAVGQTLELAALAAAELRPGEGPEAPAAWLAPALANNEQMGAIGLGARSNHQAYRDEDLDLLVEAADAVGQLLKAEARQAAGRTQLLNLAVEVENREVGLQASAQDLIAALESQLDRNFERLVEQGLQHLSDYTRLGQLGLGEELMIGGANHIERGKAVRDALVRAIESLRPAGAQPGGVLPREWHAYTILHEAYVEDVPNRDIMAKLYVSEGTFNRQRRKALHAVARSLLEAKHVPVAASVTAPAPGA